MVKILRGVFQLQCLYTFNITPFSDSIEFSCKPQNHLHYELWSYEISVLQRKKTPNGVCHF